MPLLRNPFTHLQLIKVDLVDKIRASGGISLLIGLLDFDDDPIRVIALKLIGILCQSNPQSNRATMQKSGSFEAIRLLLASRPALSIIQTIIGIALNWYKCDPSMLLLRARLMAFSVKSSCAIIAKYLCWNVT
jgi:hypothetical protein